MIETSNVRLKPPATVVMGAEQWNALPVIISAPGEYLTRDGRRVSIYKVGAVATFCTAGSIWKMFRGVERPRGYTLWAPNGRISLHTAERGGDIVGPWEGRQREG